MCATLNNFKWTLDVIAYLYVLSGTVSSCPVESQEEGSILFSVGEGQLTPTQFGRVDDHGINGVSFCGYHDRAPCGGFAFCRPVGVNCDVALYFPN